MPQSALIPGEAIIVFVAAMVASWQQRKAERRDKRGESGVESKSESV